MTASRRLLSMTPRAPSAWESLGPQQHRQSPLLACNESQTESSHSLGLFLAVAGFLRALHIAGAGGAAGCSACSLGVSIASLHVTGPCWADSAAAAAVAATMTVRCTARTA